MSRNIKSLKKLHSLIGETVHVVSSEGYEFNAVVEDGRQRSKYAVTLVTTDSRANDDPYWWHASFSENTWGHHVVRQSQLTEELRSVTTVKEKADTKTVKATKKSYVSAEYLLANEGHYCEMADGTTGFIAGSVYPDCVCVLHNSEDSAGWCISKRKEITGVTESFLKKFSKGWHVSEDDEAKLVKVAKILDKVSSADKAEQKKLSLEDLKENIGHCCTFDSGDKGYICESTHGQILVCFNTKQHGHGWKVDRDVPENLHKHFRYAYFIGDASLIEEIGIVSIDTEPCELQDIVSKKPFLFREQLLEHIGERCKMSDGTEGLIVKSDTGNPRVLMKARANNHGWSYDEGLEDDTGASKEVRSKYQYAWNVIDNGDAEDIAVVEILEDDTKKPVESSKTILDMTIREVLEKLDEIIKR